MKRKELILLENRLRKLLKEDTITYPIDNVEVEVASGVKLPELGPSGSVFDWIYDVDMDGGEIYYNTTQRAETEDNTSSESYKKPYNKGLVMYVNKNDVKMFLYSNLNSDNKPDSNNLGGASFTWLNTFQGQDEWNDFVRRIEEKKKNSLSPKIFNSKTKEIQDYIINNFPRYKDLLGTKKPNDGLWGLKTDEAILKIIYDIKNSQSQENKTGADSKISSDTETETKTETEVSTGDKTQNPNKETPKDETPKDETLKGSEETPQVQYGLGNWY